MRQIAVGRASSRGSTGGSRTCSFRSIRCSGGSAKLDRRTRDGTGGIISDHPRESLNLSADRGIPYHHLPITNGTKLDQEDPIKAIVEDTRTDLVALTRYMQVMPGDLSRYLAGRCINIHHSFLSGFKRAKPYHQTYERRVKMIGATAHFVTGDLDEGIDYRRGRRARKPFKYPSHACPQGTRHRTAHAFAGRDAGSR
jgi:hypothetical protein